MATTTEKALQAKVVTMDGSPKGSAELPAELFGQPVNEHLLWLSVKRHLGNQRQGTAKVMAKGGGQEATSKAVVMQGGNGELTATLTFSADGKLTSFDDNHKIKPGPRPICQATRLLDPDPIVRKMAEQDLLYMGLAARDYLREQRAKASPELRRAIDRLWERIVEAGW